MPSRHAIRGLGCRFRESKRWRERGEGRYGDIIDVWETEIEVQGCRCTIHRYRKNCGGGR